MKLKSRTDFVQWVENQLGAPKVRVELSPSQINNIIDEVVQYYRLFALGGGAVRGYMILELQPNQNEYQLPEDVQAVLKIAGGNRMNIWALSMMYYNFIDFYRHFDFITWQAFAQWFDTVGHVMPSRFRLQFDIHKKLLKVFPTPQHTEKILLHVIKNVDDEFLYNEKWVKDMVLAKSKKLLGEIRSKYKNIPGYGGNVSLNGEDLIGDAKEEIQKLEEQLKKFKYAKPALPIFG